MRRFNALAPDLVDSLHSSGLRMSISSDLTMRGCHDCVAVCERSDSEGRAAAQWAEDDKYRKHLQACQEAGYGFHVFAMDVFGFVPAKTTQLLLCVQSAIALRSGQSFSVVVDEVNR